MTDDLFVDSDVLSPTTRERLERQLQDEMARSIRNEQDPAKRRTRLLYAIDFFANNHRGFDARAFALQCGST